MQLGQVEKPLITEDFNPKLENRAFICSEGISSEVFCSINADEERSLRNFSKSQNCSYLTGLEKEIAEQMSFSLHYLVKFDFQLTMLFFSKLSFFYFLK